MKPSATSAINQRLASDQGHRTDTGQSTRVSVYKINLSFLPQLCKGRQPLQVEPYGEKTSQKVLGLEAPNAIAHPPPS